MPKYLSAEECYRLLQRELPEGVYADGAPSGFYSTADMFSTASGIAKLYENMERIYENFFPQTADEKIVDWEVKVFGVQLDSSLSLTERRGRVINKLRSRPTLALWEILTLVAGFVPAGTFVQVIEWGCHPSVTGWKLGVSKLGLETALGNQGDVLFLGNGNDICEKMSSTGWRLGQRRLGIDTTLGIDGYYLDLSYAQIRAYTYEVRIFGYTLPANTRIQLEAELSKREPARSGHVIFENLSLTTYGLTVPVSNVDQFSLVDCITRDDTQTTGYKGRKVA
jgi:hypothetical protein